MRIALDARTIFAPQRRGIGKSLLKLYRAIAVVQPKWQIIAYHRQKPVESIDLPANIFPRFIEMPGDRFDAWQRYRLPLAAWRDGADVIHSPANNCPPRARCPIVATVHDTIPVDLSEQYEPTVVRQFARDIRQVVRRADAVVCPSQFTADRLAYCWDAGFAQLHVVPWACDEQLPATTVDQARTVLSRFHVKPPYVLHFGSGEPRKNTRGLIQAWATLKARRRRDWTLLIIGLDAKAQQEMLNCAIQLGIDRGILMHGFASEPDAAMLLRLADVLAYPSHSEGFGLPILEAFAAGTAVLTSQTTSLPEVAGSGAVQVEPGDVAGIARHLNHLLREPMLRKDLVRKGRLRAQQFTWQASAQRMSSVFEQVVHAKRTGRRKGATGSKPRRKAA